ncbi:MAG: EamA family transporter [Defluviicoccus sp.]|jgi:drug/metabolite transporter (DMT)-like permease|nr:EamA family transporter [Defluviicoccus sp.]
MANMVGLSAFAFILGAGQLLFKAAADRAPALTRWADIPGLVTQPLLWLALALYGFATLLWIYLLQRVPLSEAYPFAALAFVLVPLGAAALFGERLSSAHFVGSALIVAGICVIGLVQR